MRFKARDEAKHGGKADDCGNGFVKAEELLTVAVSVLIAVGAFGAGSAAGYAFALSVDGVPGGLGWQYLCHCAVR